MTTVQHGRRIGAVRGSSAGSREEFQFNSNHMNGGGLDLRSVKILSREEWSRINNQLHKKEIEEAERQRVKQERLALKKGSDDLSKNWSNTVLGARQKKLQQRESRLEKEEAKRVAIDIEEAKFQAQKRKEAIEKAKIQQYYQTDRVKKFHSALLLTETLKEREAQVELKRLIESANTGELGREAQRKWREEYDEGVRKEQEKRLKRVQANKETAAYQLAQAAEIEAWRNKERDNDMKEGEEIRRLAIAHTLERQRLDDLRLQEQQRLMKNNKKQIADVHNMRRIEQQKEEEEDDECRIFAAAKKKLIRQRMEREREMHLQKQANLNKIKDKLSAQLEAITNTEETRTQNAIESKERQLEAEEAEKQRKREEMEASIQAHREATKRRLQLEKEEKLRAELEAVAAKKEADKLFRENEDRKRQRQLEFSRKIENYQTSQMDERRKNEQEAREMQLKYDEESGKLVDIEEKQFNDYAKRVIDHCEKGGRNTYPLKKAAEGGIGGGLGPQLPGKGGIRPSYQTTGNLTVELPHFKRESTNNVKQGLENNESTTKRLGFVWQ